MLGETHSGGTVDGAGHSCVSEDDVDGGLRLLHDSDLFDAVVAHVRQVETAVHAGAVFGYPAVLLGRRVVLCVYGSGIGIRLPPAYAGNLVETGRAFYFQPYGRSVMHEWVEIRTTRDRLDQLTPVFIEAIRYAIRTGTDSDRSR